MDASAGRVALPAITIVGDAGVGKSRLIAEFLSSAETSVVRGRCLPYGEGITYWPVVEVLKQLAVLPPNEVAAAAIRSLLGESHEATSAEEIAWAFRKTLEHAATERPLVVVFDDIQWGEEIFRDLIEHVALLSAGAAILLICVARPELSERRPDWPVTLRLEPLGNNDVEELIANRASAELRDKIAHAAGGNPLFIEEMLAMAGAAGDEVSVPPTLQALLAARLDQLEPAERSVLERGAVEGEIFHRGAVQTLSPTEAQVTPRLAALVRKGLIRPERPLLAGDDGFRFRHLLLRDAAYDALPKSLRAELHEHFAFWLEEKGAGLSELDELVGYHYEQACDYRMELGLSRDDDLASVAKRHLASAGRRAQLRADHGAAVSLLERAVALASPAEIDLGLEIDLGRALLDAGKGDEALLHADSLTARALAADDEVSALCGSIQAGVVRLAIEPEGATEALAVLVEQALPVFEAANSEQALYVAYRALGEVAATHAQNDSAAEAFERAAAHARQAGLSDQLLGWRAIFRLHGAAPVSEVLAWLDENELPTRQDHLLRAARAWALAMLGDFDEARTILAESRAELAERGGGIQLGVITGIEATGIELLAGDLRAAARLGEEGCKLLDELGELSFLSTAAAVLAQAYYELDRLEEADRWAGRAVDTGASDDAPTQMLWRQVRAKVLARRGEHAEAEGLTREAVAIGDETQYLNGQADAHADLAEVLLLAGRHNEAVDAFEEALECYERKENLVSAQLTRARLAEIGRAN